MGHYIGLYQFGKEVMNRKNLSIYGTDRVCQFFGRNEPWTSFINQGNFQMQPIEPDRMIKLSENVSIKPLLVPHRGEYSDTVAYYVKGPNKTIFYCPDVDTWHKGWSIHITDVINSVDRAFLDSTFFSGDELPGRNINDVPHPTTVDTIKTLNGLENKVTLIHLNHTNPLYRDGKEREQCVKLGFDITQQGSTWQL
ncbi:unnamed protein product [Didymodactylos carnosus]|uniref:Metallo-beta-lactamase domain-containing protein n=1 Tax=Didymodactylos carnosus TaxID=1234261 RepID=A0A815ZEL3_9BILA|nr:unnamed protein product [Didymodactylos carnosus]CAF4452605.1 unnamed protein product [Didymodactylos carnosus]